VVWKDPRFVWTLHHWGPVLTKLASVPTPLLIHVRRDLSDVATSYRRRNETCFQDGSSPERAIAARSSWALWQLRQWCGPAISIDISSLGIARRANHLV
jgi:hypothetical protein